jgi:hypothetical protein
MRRVKNYETCNGVFRVLLFLGILKTMKKIIIFLLMASTMSAQTISEAYANSLKSYKRKKYDSFLTWSKKLDSLRPMHPKYTYNLAAAYALNNKPEHAFATLKNAILMNSESGFEQDSDFVSLKNLPGYDRLLSLKQTVEKPMLTSQKVVSLSEKSLHPEGFVYLPKKKQWLCSSIRKGKIVSFDLKTGKCTDWLDTDYAVFAMKPDAEEKYLWVATSAIEEMEGFKPELNGKGEILKVNIKTKAVESRYSIDGKHIYGDLVVARNGAVYVSDSRSPIVYKIADNAMQPWFSVNDRICNLQGLAFSADESKLYLADYFNGIAEIPVANPAARRWLAFPDGTIQKGIDGLAWYNNSLVAVHNGVNPIRIIRYFLDGSGNISGFKVIDNNRPEFNEPALVHITGDKCYFFANCPWQAYDKRHQLDESKFENPVLYSFSLKP